MTDETKGDVTDTVIHAMCAAYDPMYEHCSGDTRADMRQNMRNAVAVQSAMRVDDAISLAPTKLRGLAKVIREHGTCAAAALEHVADEIQAAIGEKHD